MPDNIFERGVFQSGQQKTKAVLVANRGEIAIRIFRTAKELGLRTIAVYSDADKLSRHRFEADASFEIGKGLNPVDAYISEQSQLEIIDLASKYNACIHPGYGFLSENAVMARRCQESGVLWVGPEARVIEALGSKINARTLAEQAGVPVVSGSGRLGSIEEVKNFVTQYGLPVLLKASAGGGGRGLRVVRHLEELSDAFARCQSEAKAAFGNDTLFIERYLDKPRHIEVQVLADVHGEIMCLSERDCSLQRRHQKVLEIAPAQNLPDTIKDQLADYAKRICIEAQYKNAGTVEFLVDQQHKIYFLEVNPRIQVEHTITEQIFGIDLIRAQILVAHNVALHDLHITTSFAGRVSIQARVTCEDVDRDFMPDSGRIGFCRLPSGPSIRIDSALSSAGAVITPFYDSLLAKIIVTADTYDMASQRLLRALAETQINGVGTNIEFLMNLLRHQVVKKSLTWTTFIESSPDLCLKRDSGVDYNKTLNYVVDKFVNWDLQGTMVSGQIGEPKKATARHAPKAEIKLARDSPAPSGWRHILLEQGPADFAKSVREHERPLITDTTWRDAHQSILATRIRTVDLEQIAEFSNAALMQAFSLEMWGGATFDVCLNFLHECPWDRLARLRKLVPNIPFQMLIRGSNAVGYGAYPEDVIEAFTKAAKDAGIDIFRIFDSLNDIENLKPGIRAIHRAGGVVEAAICYSGVNHKYTIQYYVEYALQLLQCEVHFLAIKDMAGILTPKSVTDLIGAIRKVAPEVPIHLHMHDTAGLGVATLLAAVIAGVDIIDVAQDPMSGTTSQPAMGAVCVALDELGSSTGVRLEHIMALNSYWNDLRLLYRPFEANIQGSNIGVLQSQMPGGQYTNLKWQSEQNLAGQGSQWAQVQAMYVEASAILGHPIKVTPSSKVVGDLAQWMLVNGLDRHAVSEQAGSLDFPVSVIKYLQGDLGIPYGGFPEPYRSKVLKREVGIVPDRVKADPVDLEALWSKLKNQYGPHITHLDVLSSLMFPKAFDDYQMWLNRFGHTDRVETAFFLSRPRVNQEVCIQLGEHNAAVVKILAASAKDETGHVTVFCELNGEQHGVVVLDRHQNEHAQDKSRHSKQGDLQNPHHVTAPMNGVVLDLQVHQGDTVRKGQAVVTLSAMKLETTCTSKVAGRVRIIHVTPGDSIKQGQLLMEIE